jgi:predicted PurR-regulated permease PerM
VVSAFRDFLGSLFSLGKAVLTGLASLILVVIGGFFLAAAPDRYCAGLVKLFPPQHHENIDSALRLSGNALRLWLFGQLISMAIVGVLVGLGTWLLGLPAPLALGVFAGLMEFIPILGPWLGAVPAVLLAVSEGGWTVLWTIVLFLAIQQVESNLITPLVQQQLVEIPAALLLFAVVGLGLLFGAIGVLVAAPLAVVLYVLVKKLYVRETLGEPTRIPGEA